MDGDPERRPFLDKLLHFMEERGTPIAQCPTISKNPLDLYRLYLFTKEKGGFMEVCMPVFKRRLIRQGILRYPPAGASAGGPPAQILNIRF